MSILAIVKFMFDGASRLLDPEGDRTLVRAYFSIVLAGLIINSPGVRRCLCILAVVGYYD